MKLGQYEVELLPIGRFRMDGGGLFGIVPRKLWSRAYPHVDDENRLELATYALLVRGPGITLVADAGVGEKLDPKARSIFAVEQPENAVATALATRGICSADVTHFVYTHLHFDHAGGATYRHEDGTPKPVFPNAKHFVQAEQLAWARNPSDKDRASFVPDNWEPVAEAGKLTELHGDTELLPDLELRVVHGHTPGLQMILVRSGADQPEGNPSGLMFSVDLFPTAAHLPAHYVAAFDNHPLLALEEKRRVLKQVAAEGWALGFGHDPFTPCATLKPAARGLVVDQVFR